MTVRRLPLAKLFPGKVVARVKIWYPTWTVGMEGPMAPELARLIVAVCCAERDPKLLATLDAIATELQDRGKNSGAPQLSDRAMRKKLSKARSVGRIGRRA